MRAAWALAYIGAPAERAIPALMEATKGDDDMLRDMAAYALEKIRQAQEEAGKARTCN